jgi:hypothetical protein
MKSHLVSQVEQKAMQGRAAAERAIGPAIRMRQNDAKKRTSGHFAPSSRKITVWNWSLRGSRHPAGFGCRPLFFAKIPLHLQ